MRGFRQRRSDFDDNNDHDYVIANRPVSTTRVDGPSLLVTGFHNPSTRAALTGARFPLAELTGRVDG